VTITIVCPGYVATEIDDKKMLGDGSVEAVELNVDKSKYMPANVRFPSPRPHLNRLCRKQQK